MRRLEGALPDTGNLRRRVDDVARVAGTSMANLLKLTRMAVQNREDRVRALDPAATLRRGFSVVQKQINGQVVTSTAQVTDGDSLSITVSNGLIAATAGSQTKLRPVRKRQKPTVETATMKRLL